MSNTKHCSACGKSFVFVPAQSPMIHDELWQKVLDFYSLKEIQVTDDDVEYEPMYCCIDCMEKALGRELTERDIRPALFNIHFRLHRFYGLPVETVRKIWLYMKEYVLNAPTFHDRRGQYSHAYLNGVMRILQILQESGYDTSRLH